MHISAFIVAAARRAVPALVAAALAGAAALSPLPTPFQARSAAAQDFFIPGQGKPPAGAPARPPRPARPPAGAVQPQPQLQPPLQPQFAPQGPPEPEPPPIQVTLPPGPDLPPLPPGPRPQTAVIGVLGVPDIMRASAAAQQIEKIIGERREKLNDDAQKEQLVWRDMQAALTNDQAKLNPEQLAKRQRELQERITSAQKQFRDRNRIIQEAAQYSIGQIERTLIGVIRQVAESRGMNLVLHRQQVALNVDDFDITALVTEQLNKVLPSVTIPPDGVSPASLPPPAVAATSPTGATPVAAPTVSPTK